MSTTQPERVRLDKWLWAARFFKTRTLAKEAIEGGKVHCNGQRAKPGRSIEPGTELTIRRGWEEWTVIVLALSEKRLSAPLAQALYEETEASKEKRARMAIERKAMLLSQHPPARRPNKRERRHLQALKHSQNPE
ncbi:ribosome-associated heat shock protein Hsp15 [Hahella sp. SMD15-11]|uniref:Heat shock protein 15 n=1 Tax=Thermohahella caldifontis TaxID=3142973 RepID=A0AB39UUF8_9GAMM